MKSTLLLIPLIQSDNLPNNILDDLSNYLYSFNEPKTLDEDNLIYIDWEDEEYLLDFKKFLLDEYGNDIKQYEYLAIAQII